MTSLYARPSILKHCRPYSQSSLRKPTLPRLPIPNLRATLDRYLLSLQPLLKEDEYVGGPSYNSAYAARVKLAEDFEAGLGKICQQRLKELDQNSPYNWLDDNFWMQKAYLEWRVPLPINSNWWLSFHNDTQVPSPIQQGYSPGALSGYTPWQIRRATWLVHRFLQFKESMSSELNPDTTRKGVWLQENVARFFSSCRTPQKGCDTVQQTSFVNEPSARRLVVMARDWFYLVRVYDDKCNLLPPARIESSLRQLIRDVDSRLQEGETPIPVGVLTADNRDVWAKNLDYLLSISPKNKCTYSAIASSVLCLCLDHYTYVMDPPIPLNSQAEMDSHLHNLRSGTSGLNRWFDKTGTIIVESNTRAGAMGEHSPLDALVPSIIAEYAVVEGVSQDAFTDDASTFACQETANQDWERLEWVTDDIIARECAEASQRVNSLIADSDHSVMWFENYGADWIKGVAQLSPDAFIQMALQVVWYRMRGEFTATYETVLTRMFQHGRTETVRTLSSESRLFVQSMMDPNCSATTRYTLLRAAVQHHSKLTREAATGRGIDRHLMGLRLMLRPEDGESSPFFEDPLFTRSQTWKLSTSGLSAGHLFRGTGFGAAYEDGYGINYLAAPDLIKFGIESKHNCPLTSTAEFKAHLTTVLEELKDVCTQGVFHRGPNVDDEMLRSRL